MDTYEKKLALAKEALDSGSYDKETIEYIFPELKESEDERIRKELIEFVKSRGGFKQEYIAWLEKQEGCEYIKKDWLEHIKQSWYKEGFIDGKYSGGTSKEWTINDAATLKELIDFLENGTVKLQHDLTKYANWLKIQFTPIEKQGEQNPVWRNAVWSGEDERIIDNLISQLGNLFARKLIKEETKDKYVNWLKSLRPQSQWKPSEEQMKAFGNMLKFFHMMNAYGETIDELKELLEQLKEL